MRIFIAIEFSDMLKKQICDIQTKLRVISQKGRWKYIDNFHLTLKFLGEVDLRKLTAVKRRMETVCKETEPFTLRISKAGMFPGKRCIRVVWLGVEGDTEKLYKLHEKIENSLNDMDIKKERRQYTPHVTIGQDIKLNKSFSEIKKSIDVRKLQEIKVDRIHLFKSEQSGGKRIYTSVFDCMFKF